MKKIVVLGSTNTDMVIAGKKIPVAGETISGGKFLMNPGGKGANQAVAVARLSAKRIFAPKLGTIRVKMGKTSWNPKTKPPRMSSCGGSLIGV